MSVTKVQRTRVYVNNAHRSIVLAVRLLRNVPFDKVCPREQMHPTAQPIGQKERIGGVETFYHTPGKSALRPEG